MSDLKTTTGFTDDGKVFLQFQADSQDGVPVTGTLMWEPERAVNVAKALIEAADRAVSKRGFAIVGG